MTMIRNILYLLLIIISLQVIRIDSVQTDGTLVPGKSGINVVVATLEKIFATSDIFYSDWFHTHGHKSLIKQFLRYKAYVDTEFGKSESPGGIWNVSMEQFSEAKSHVQASDYHLGLRSSLQIDWRNVSYSDMSVPMYSCLAIMFYLDARVLTPQFPYWLRGRQQFERLWEDYLDGRSGEKTWENEVEELDANSNCNIKSDVVFVVDASNSITEADLGEAKDMVYSYTAKLDAPSGDNRIGIILIQTTAMVYLSLDILTNETLRRIKEIPYVPYHFTNTADALCKLSQQAWRHNDSSTLQVAIVLTDGRSSHHVSECEGDTETVADFIHEQYPHIIVFAIGIGEESNINEIELAHIASRPHLITRLGHYEDLEFMEGSFRYEICYTLSTPINQGTESHGTVDKNQIVRWIMEGIGDDGITIRMCIRSGRLTLYVSHLPTPSEALYDNRATIAITDKMTIGCGTIFVDTSSESINSNNNIISGKRKRRQASQNSTTLYFAIVGEINNTKFSINSESGNVTIDINECQLKPHPCHESATCFNTDGSFYCECQEGFIGDGLINCTGLTSDIIHVYNRLAVILPSVILSIIILLLLTVLIVLISLKFPRPKLRKIDNCKAKVVPKVYESELQFVRENLKKVNKPISATNPLSVIK